MDRNELVSAVISRMKQAAGVQSDNQLSLCFGSNRTLISNKKQRGSIPFEECLQMAQDGFSLDWLILGRGEPKYGSPSPVTGASASPEESDEFVSVPLYDIQAAAGNGRLFEAERIKYYVHFRRDWLSREGLYQKDLACAEVHGDSMEPTLRDSDTVLINRARRSGDGVFVLRMGEALRIKRLQWRADRSLRISSDNEIYAPELLHPDQLSQVEILGHCHWRAGKIY